MAINSPFRSSADLVTEALSNLGVLAAGQPIDTEDFNWIQEKLDAIFRQIAGLEIAYVADPSNIPGAWFAPLADIVAGECASKFGLVDPEYTLKVNRGLGGAGGVPIGAGTAAMALKIITRGRPTYEPLRFYNF